MARTVAGTRADVGYTHTVPFRRGRDVCSFCSEPPIWHQWCPGQTHTNPGRKDDKVWTCQCWKEGHPNGNQRSRGAMAPGS